MIWRKREIILAMRELLVCLFVCYSGRFDFCTCQVVCVRWNVFDFFFCIASSLSLFLFFFILVLLACLHSRACLPKFFKLCIFFLFTFPPSSSFLFFSFFYFYYPFCQRSNNKKHHPLPCGYLKEQKKNASFFRQRQEKNVKDRWLLKARKSAENLPKIYRSPNQRLVVTL